MSPDNPFSECHPAPDVLPWAQALGASRPRIGVVGNLNADLIFRDVARLPAWGQEVEATSRIEVSAGQAGYLAHALASLRARVTLVGVVGDDGPGRRLIEELETAGVAGDHVERRAGVDTGLTVALVRPDGERAFISDFAAGRHVDGAFLDRHRQTFTGCDAVCLVGVLNLPNLDLAVAREFLAERRRAGQRTMLDTGWDPDGWSAGTVEGTRALLSEVDVFMPNLDECRAVLGEFDSPQTAADALHQLGPDTVIVKCGAAGSTGRSGEETASVPAVPVDVHDAVGAGDAFDGAFMWANAAGAGLRQGLSFASAAAAHYVSRAMDRFPTIDDVIARLTAGW